MQLQHQQQNVPATTGAAGLQRAGSSNLLLDDAYVASKCCARPQATLLPLITSIDVRSRASGQGSATGKRRRSASASGAGGSSGANSGSSSPVLGTASARSVTSYYTVGT